MTGPLHFVGRLRARHHWTVIAAWIAVAVAVFLVAHAAGDQTSDNLTLPGTGSTRAQNATIVRCLVVPAIMTLLGGACWWMPRWMGRALPRISVEGSEYFARREAKPHPANPQ